METGGEFMDEELSLEQLEGVRAGMTSEARDYFYANRETLFSQGLAREQITSLEELSHFLGGADPRAVLETAKNNPGAYSPEDVAWLEDRVNNLESKGMRR